MEDFINPKNIGIINIASRNMISDKFNIEFDDNELSDIIDHLVEVMHDEFKAKGLKINELNNIALSRVKDMLLNREKSSHQNNQINQLQPDTKASETKFDDDLINIKLQELESRRKAIPEFSEKIEEIPKERHENVVYKPNPISITVPKTKKYNYKTLMINSINRDWIKQPFRNNIKFGMSVDTSKNIFFPDCLCLPKFVKNITPYVLMVISDGSKTIYYSFTPTYSGDGKWDIWRTVDNPEKISLSGKTWSIKLLDFTHNDLKLGEDICKVTQVTQVTQATQNDNNGICLKYDKPIGNNIAIKMKNNQTIYKTVTTSTDHTFVLYDDFDMTDFIEARILNVDEQFSFIIKYCYRLD